MERFLYRICSVEEFSVAQAEGLVRGNDLDKKSGFIHLSRKNQVSGVLERFFPGREDLMLLVIDTEKVGEQGVVKYDEIEPGVFFPHFYGLSGEFVPLPLDAAVECHKIELESGLHKLCFTK